MVSDFHGWLNARIHHNVHSRTELDEADTLAARNRVTNFLVEDDSSSNQSRDLLEDHRLPFAFDGDDVLFIFLGAVRGHRVQEFSFLIAHITNHATNGRAVHVHVEDVQEDADTQRSAPLTAILETSVTLPSPGETIAPGVSGTIRSGSRKNHRQNAASSHAGVPQGGLVSQAMSNPASSKGTA